MRTWLGEGACWQGRGVGTLGQEGLVRVEAQAALVLVLLGVADRALPRRLLLLLVMDSGALGDGARAAGVMVSVGLVVAVVVKDFSAVGEAAGSGVVKVESPVVVVVMVEDFGAVGRGAHTGARVGWWPGSCW